MKHVYIYSLSDPNTQEIRYIGKTINIKKRLLGHISEAKKQSNRYVLNWIKSLIRDNKKPIINTIEVCTEENWEERERFWISFYKQSINLCNICNGGLGGSGQKNYSNDEILIRKERMKNLFSKFTDNEKHEIWTLIQNNYNYLFIKELYPNYSRQIHFGVKNGRQWNSITNIPKTIGNRKRKGYTFNCGLYIVTIKVNGKRKTIFSSKYEQEVLNYLEMDR